MAKGVKRKDNRSNSDPGRNIPDKESNRSIIKDESVDYTDSKGFPLEKRPPRERISDISTISSNSDIPLRQKQSTRRMVSSVFSTATFAYIRRNPGCTLINIYILKILFWDLLVSGGDVVTDFLRVNCFYCINCAQYNCLILFRLNVFCRKSGFNVLNICGLGYRTA